MIHFGEVNRLQVIEVVDAGISLDGESLGRLFLPKKELEQPAELGQWIDVFLYNDPDKGPTITAQRPRAQAGEFALLRVVGVTAAGAFLDWGLPKDLFAPARLQAEPMEQGRSYMVRLYNDQGDRTVASSRLDHFLDLTPPPYRRGDKVDLLIDDRTDLGYKAIVDNAFWGVLYRNEVFQPLTYGQRISGYIKQVRDDDKIDLSLQAPGHQAALSLADQILQALDDAGGFLPLSDRSSPHEIQHYFAASKKKFKNAVGTLYKKRLIAFEEGGIRRIAP